MLGSKKLLSVVVPCYNEEAVLHETHRRLRGVLQTLDDLEFELIYVDDGSRDGTVAILRELQAADPSIRVIRFSRNFGHQTAVTAGIDHAAGDAVVLIDADLQDPPEVIRDFVARWKDGYDVAYGMRASREGETRFKRWTAMGFYRFINRLSEVQIPLDTGDFRLMDRAVVDALRSMPEHDRFVRGMVSWVGFQQIAVSYERAPRLAGESKYPLTKMLRFALDGIVSFSIVPLRLATWVGFATSALAFIGAIYAIAVRLLTDNWVSGWAGLFVAILFFGGVQLLAAGVIGEYVGRVYSEVKRRPLYVVAESMGFQRRRTLPAREWYHREEEIGV